MKRLLVVSLVLALAACATTTTATDTATHAVDQARDFYCSLSPITRQAIAEQAGVIILCPADPAS